MENIKSAWSAVQFGVAGVGGIMSMCFGTLDSFLYALIAFIVLDYITGIIAAVRLKKLSSEVGFAGIAKKVVILMLVMVGHVVDMVIGVDGTFRMMVICFYLTNEGVSILENAVNIGLKVPKKLRTILEQISNDDDDNKPIGGADAAAV